ncbi:MAG: alpha-glucan family phosphorylase [Candidatus Omnitrophica bacterium]|nr:alpha-glucan family phosphorylase [Candidatus Omnitrophota bacterium]
MIHEFLSLVDIENFQAIYQKDISDDKYFGLPLEPIIACEKRLRAANERGIAYFSMEYGLATSFYNKFTTHRPIDFKNKTQEHEVFSNFRLADYFFTLKMDSIIDLPIYSGGLGVLAGDTLKTMADYKLAAVGIGMLWNTGYFRQKFWFKYGQLPEKIHWDVYSYPGLVPLKNRVKISLRNEEIILRLWKYYIYSYKHDYALPLILLDANIEPNSNKMRSLTDQLYRSDDVWIRVMQRVILGMGGVAALKEMGYHIDLFHLNEGHAAFAFLEKARGLSKKEIEALKGHFFYTCHTPVEAGHDRFRCEDLSKILKKEDFEIVQEYGRDVAGWINLTHLAMNVSSVTNAVSKSHQKVMHLQFPRYRETIKYVTNGVHHHTWLSDRFMNLFEKFSSTFVDVKANPYILAKARDLRQDQDFRRDLWLAHQENKADLCRLLEKWKLDKDVFTICWARRVAAYKRPSMIFYDINRLLDIAKKIGPLQIIFAGKAHPADNLGYTFINEILDKVDGLTDVYDYLRIILLENYEIYLAKLLTSSVDVWLNNPLPPFEASGTSGMKAILNGIIQLTTLDGWVAEAAHNNIGKIFGYRYEEPKLGSEYDLHLESDSQQLYLALEELVHLYYRTNKRGKVDLSSPWIDMMIDCIATAAEFNTYRMLDNYKHSIWHIY